MKMPKIKKRKIALTLTVSLILSLMMSTFVFADVLPGPKGQYCTLTYISGNYNAWNSTPSNPMLGGRSSVGTDVLGNVGGLPVTIQFSNVDNNGTSDPCKEYQFYCYEVDSTGKMIGTFHATPIFSVPTSLQTGSQGSLSVQLPSSWLTAGHEYAIYSVGIFDGLTSCPESYAYVNMLN